MVCILICLRMQNQFSSLLDMVKSLEDNVTWLTFTFLYLNTISKLKLKLKLTMFYWIITVYKGIRP